MEFKEFGVSILEFFIANIPTLFLLTTLFVKNLKEIKGKVDMFDVSMKNTEEKVVNKFDKNIEKLLDNVDERLNKTIDKVDKTLDKMGEEISEFTKELNSINIHIEHLYKINKTSLDIISILLSGDDELISKGVSTLLVNKMNLTKEEIERYPELVSLDNDFFYKALKEQFVLLGNDKIDELVLKAKKEILHEKEKLQNKE